MPSTTPCPVCLSQHTTTAFEAQDYTVSGEMFHVWKCNDCTFHFTAPVPPESEIGKYYKSEDYISHSNTSRGLINRAYQTVRNITLRSKRKLITRNTGKSKGKLLDIGCGTGNFLNNMKQAGWDVSGIEPSPEAREQAQKNFGITPMDPAKLYNLPDGKYDAVTMWHVLEHVYDLDGYMKKIRSLLAPGGKAFIAVPNHLSVDAVKYGPGWAAWDVPRHLYHFNPHSMEVLLKRSGFRLLGMKRMPFDSFYVSMLSEKYRKGGMIAGVWTGFRSWVAALVNKRRCSSLIYIIEPIN